MEERLSYENQMDELLTTKAGYLDRVELKGLKDNFKLFQSAFQGLYGVLYKKGIIHEDPYKYELKISEVATPPESPFTEAEKVDQMSVRLSQYESYLDFLNNYYQFSVDFLTMARIKRLVALVKYFAFTQFAETSQHVNTRCFAELVGMVRKGTDQLSTGIINESISTLDRVSREIFQVLKSLTLFHKERYKLDMRKLVFPSLHLQHDFAITHREEAVKRVRHTFAEVAGDKPFYPELVEEILVEDFSDDGQSLKDEIVKQLAVHEEKKKDGGHDRNFKSTILDGVRIIVGAGFQMNDAAQKLTENSAIVQSQDKGFFARLGKLLARMFNSAEKEIFYEIDYLDPVTNLRKEDKIQFTTFIQDLTRKAQSFNAMAGRTSAAYARIAQAPEEQAFKFLEKSIEETQRFHRKLIALDEFFKNVQIAQEDKPRIRSIKSELETIKNAIIKANQKKYEYVSQKEEIEQMKRLGIRTDV